MCNFFISMYKKCKQHLKQVFYAWMVNIRTVLSKYCLKLHWINIILGCFLAQIISGIWNGKYELILSSTIYVLVNNRIEKRIFSSSAKQQYFLLTHTIVVQMKCRIFYMVLYLYYCSSVLPLVLWISSNVAGNCTSALNSVILMVELQDFYR